MSFLIVWGNLHEIVEPSTNTLKDSDNEVKSGLTTREKNPEENVSKTQPPASFSSSEIGGFDEFSFNLWKSFCFDIS